MLEKMAAHVDMSETRLKQMLDVVAASDNADFMAETNEQMQSLLNMRIAYTSLQQFKTHVDAYIKRQRTHCGQEINQMLADGIVEQEDYYNTNEFNILDLERFEDHYLKNPIYDRALVVECYDIFDDKTIIANYNNDVLFTFDCLAEFKQWNIDKMVTFTETAASLQDLCSLLNDINDAVNEYNGMYSDGLKMEDQIDLCSLTTFGTLANDRYRDDAFSYNDTHYLYFDPDCNGKIGAFKIKECLNEE